MLPLYEKGERNYIVIGKSDFAHLVEMVLKEAGLNDYQITYEDEVPHQEIQGVLLICREDVNLNSQHSTKVFNLVHELAKDDLLVTHTKAY